MARRKSNVTKEVKVNNRDAKAFEILSNGGWVSKDIIVDITSNNRVEVWRDKGIWEVKTYPSNNGESHTSIRLTNKGEKYAEKMWGLTDHARTKVSSIVHDTAVGNKLCSLSENERKTVMTEDAQWKYLHNKIAEKSEEIESLRGKSVNYKHVSPEEREEARVEWVKKLDEINRINEMLKNKEISAPDLAYVSETGALICYEVTTSNYSREEIQQKESFAAIIGATIIKERV